MLTEQNPYIASAYKQLQVISQDEQKRMEYTARLKAQLDHNQMMFEAEERGIKKGRAEGRADERKTNIRNMVKNMAGGSFRAASVWGGRCSLLGFCEGSAGAGLPGGKYFPCFGRSLFKLNRDRKGIELY